MKVFRIIKLQNWLHNFCRWIAQLEIVHEIFTKLKSKQIQQNFNYIFFFEELERTIAGFKLWPEQACQPFSSWDGSCLEQGWTRGQRNSHNRTRSRTQTEGCELANKWASEKVLYITNRNKKISGFYIIFQGTIYLLFATF